MDNLTAAFVFCLVMVFTPGPNNVMLTSSGANFGLKRTLPHAAGVALGFPIMLFIVGLGLASLLQASDRLQIGMKIISSVYLLWLAFQIAANRSFGGNGQRSKPISFLQAAAFQWINPKAWLIAIGAISAYTSGSGERLYIQVAIVALLSLIVSLASSATWMTCGAVIGKWLKSPAARRAFNLVMALLLVASVVPIMLEIARAN